jgi:hypothetical protein
MQDKKENERPLAYPRPTQTDTQLNNQPEYIDQQPNDFSDRSVSDVPLSGKPDATISNDPSKETQGE